ncbi:MAG: DUF1772 domain-containing protein [Pseudonocardia sp.]|nr:DUF1772 domain-containing protein [Pseudonocardia sp.]
MTVLVIATLVGCGLMAGIYAAFSVAVLPGLRLRPAAEAAETMRAVDRRILNPVFGLLFGGTAVLCLATAVLGAVLGGTPLLITGAVVSLVGGHGTTVAVNIPLNNRLDRGGEWAAFVRPWAVANHVRGLASTAAAAVLAVGLT